MTATDAALVTLTIPGPPQAKQRARVGHGRAYTPLQTVRAEQRIAEYFKVAYPHHVPLTGRLHVVLLFHLKGVRGDADNFCKLVLDSGNGRIWVDDKQIDMIQLQVVRNSAEPRTELEVYAA